MLSLSLALTDQFMAPAVGFLTGWLLMGAVGTAWLALRMRQQPRPQDLEQLHRLIDRLREELKQTDPQTRQAAELRQALRTLNEALPADDLRRRVAS